VALVSASGTLVCSAALAVPPAAPLVAGDLNGDGWADAVVVAADRVTVLVLRHRSVAPLVVLVLAALAAVAAALWVWNRSALVPALRDVAVRVTAALTAPRR
jgi:hypothetical protein